MLFFSPPFFSNVSHSVYKQYCCRLYFTPSPHFNIQNRHVEILKSVRDS
jgi:hypothetical protein